MVTEDNFIEELQKKNVEAIDYIFNCYGNLIYKIAYLNLNSKELSEECLNDVLLKVWINSSKFNQSKGEFKNWISTITKNLAIYTLRKNKNIKLEQELDEGLSSNTNIEDEINEKLSIKEVEEMLKHLKPIDRYILINKFFIGKKTKDIAKELEVNMGYVNLRIYRCRKILKEALERK